MPKSDYLSERLHQLFPLAVINLTTGMSVVDTIYEPEHNEAVQGVEVFQNFMAILIEKSK